MSIAAKFLPIVAALLSAGWTAPAPELPSGLRPEPVAMRAPMGPGHGPPDVRQFYICRVLPQYGGDFCTSPPYAPVGKHCTCEGPRGPRPGVVEHR
jgi:hypothetical protein